MSERNSSVIFLLVALALVPLMPSADSLWVDEAQTWRYARHTSLSAAWDEFQGERFSETQMPLGMAAAWSWARIFGTSEFALRAPNMLYAAGAILCFYLIGRKEDAPLLPLFFAVQPYLWFYVNEARPYALQIFGGSLLLLALHQVYRGNISSIRWVIAWGAGALVCSASSMLGAIPTLAFTVALFWELLRKHYLLGKGQLVIFAGTTLSLLALGFYYLQTLLAGSGGSKIWSVGLQNLIFSVVEFLGFAGMLPPRQELREMARAGLDHSSEVLNLWPFALPTILMAAVFVVIGLFWVQNFRQTPRWVAASVAVVVGSVVLLLAASLIVGFPFWGRHLAPAFPAFVAAVGWAVTSAWRGPLPLVKVSAACLFALLLASSLMIRFSETHSKDDYRTAAAFAHETLTRGGTVWWAADPAGASYYGLNPSPADTAATNTDKPVVLASNVTAIQALNLPQPDLVILSKTDIYDSRGYLQAWLSQNKYALRHTAKAFWIFDPATLDEH
jgi:uncharacterized membrane protein